MSDTPSAATRAPAPGRAAFDRDEQRRRKREAVLRVAASAFNRRGFANTSMDDVASVLGVSKPTLYQYFKSKQELLYACHQVEWTMARRASPSPRPMTGRASKS